MSNKNDETSNFTKEDIENNKTLAGLAYFIFFLPLIAAPDSKYGKFHANQGLMVLLTSVIGSTVLGLIPIIGWTILPIFGVAVLVVAIMGLINGFGGKAVRLPLIGNFDIIK